MKADKKAYSSRVEVVKPKIIKAGTQESPCWICKYTDRGVSRLIIFGTREEAVNFVRRAHEGWVFRHG